MKLFVHTSTTIRIINGDLEWSGTPAEFQALEPLYPGLPAGATLRSQTQDFAYYEDNAGAIHPDSLNCLGYCDQVSTYLITNCVWARVALSAATLNVNDPQASIHVEAHIKPTSDPAGPDLPIYESWIIRPWHETGARDSLLFAFANGVCTETYTYLSSLPLGDWWIREEDFNPISVGGATYRVRLANVVKFTLYRELI